MGSVGGWAVTCAGGAMLEGKATPAERANAVGGAAVARHAQLPQPAQQRWQGAPHLVKAGIQLHDTEGVHLAYVQPVFHCHS